MTDAEMLLRQACEDGVISHAEIYNMGPFAASWDSGLGSVAISNGHIIYKMPASVLLDVAERTPRPAHLWCAFCGEYGDHQSGWCKNLADK